MKHWPVVFVSTCLLAFTASPLWAKRVPAPKVTPVVHGGVKYVAPNDNGTKAYVQAEDVKTGKVIWRKTVFTVSIDPNLESDVQHIYIKLLKVRKNQLYVTLERNLRYIIDLKTGKVRKHEAKPPLPEP